MSTSVLLFHNLMFFKQKAVSNSMFLHDASHFVVQLSGEKRSRLSGFISNAEKKPNHSRKTSWWKKFFFDDDGNWLGLKDDDMVEEDDVVVESEVETISEGEKFEAWRRRAEAIVELREAQEDESNEEHRRWGDWLLDETNNEDYMSSWSQDWDNETKETEEKVGDDPNNVVPQKGVVESLRFLIFGEEDDDLLYEDRVFQYASLNSVSA